MQIVALDRDNVPSVHAVYHAAAATVSYYFPVRASVLERALYGQPEVHPAAFEMLPEASLVAYESGKPVGWIHSGYLSDIPAVPAGECDALIRGLLVTEGGDRAARELLRAAVSALGQRRVHAWRAFEHNSGYTFAAGIGKLPHCMGTVADLLDECGFQVEDSNLVYAATSLRLPRRPVNPRSIEVQVQPEGWSEIGGRVRWDWFTFFDGTENVGYATVIPVGRLTENRREDSLFVKGIAVGAGHRRRGIGSLIMRTLWEHYHPRGMNRLILNTGERNYAAQRFYEAIGFEITDRISSYIAEHVPRVD